jgi:hypothetical protein
MRAGLIKNSRMVCVELCIHVIFISRSLCTLHDCLCEKSHISSFSLHWKGFWGWFFSNSLDFFYALCKSHNKKAWDSFLHG